MYGPATVVLTVISCPTLVVRYAQIIAGKHNHVQVAIIEPIMPIQNFTCFLYTNEQTFFITTFNLTYSHVFFHSCIEKLNYSKISVAIATELRNFSTLRDHEYIRYMLEAWLYTMYVYVSTNKHIYNILYL